MTLDLSIDASDGAGISWLHRNSEVLNKELHDGRFDMTVRVDETKRDIVIDRFSRPATNSWISTGSMPCHTRFHNIGGCLRVTQSEHRHRSQSESRAVLMTRTRGTRESSRLGFCLVPQCVHFG